MIRTLLLILFGLSGSLFVRGAVTYEVSATATGLPFTSVVDPVTSTSGRVEFSGSDQSGPFNYKANRSWRAFAGPGQLGVDLRQSLSGGVPIGVGAAVLAEFSLDDLIFNAGNSDPLADITLNLQLAGFLSQASSGSARLRVTTSLDGATRTGELFLSQSGISTNGILAGLGTSLDSFPVDVTYTGVPVNTPLALTVRLEVENGGRFGGDVGDADYYEGLTLSRDSGVFSSTDPDFISADAASIALVDNVHLIPEPGVATLVGGFLGLLLTGARAERRRQQCPHNGGQASGCA